LTGIIYEHGALHVFEGALLLAKVGVPAGKAIRAAHLSALEESGESQVSLTDPDSRAMAAHTKVGVGYNAQVAVDAKNKMIVDQDVTNQVVDMGLLTQAAEPARAILEVATIDVVADRGTPPLAGCHPSYPPPSRS
jgi:hypothetical protein